MQARNDELSTERSLRTAADRVSPRHIASVWTIVRRIRQRRGVAKLTLLILLAFAAIASGGGLWWYRQDETADGVGTKLVHTVERGDFVLTVTERGEVESSDDVEIRCEVKSQNSAGTQILRLAPEGGYVEAEDFLVELDASALDADRITQQIAVNRSEATMIEAQNLFDTAVIAKKEYIEGTVLQEEQTIESEIFVAEENLSRAKEYLKYSEKLAAKGHITEQQLEADAFAVEKSEKELEAAQTKLRVLEDFTKLKMMTQLESEIRTANAKWEAEKNSYQLEANKLQEIEDQIAKCRITAPSAGIVMYAHETSRRGENDFIVEPGAMVRERQIIIRLPNKDKMQVLLKVNESLVKYVRAGASAVIRPIGLGGLVLPGTVVRVSEYSEPTGWRKANVKEYRAYVSIDEANAQLRSGMTTSVTVECAYLPGVLQVPVQSLYPHGGDSYCFVRDGSGWDARKVQRGPTNEEFFVIKEGLAEGDVVALNPRKLVGKVDLPELAPEDTQQARRSRPGPPKQAVTKGESPGDKRNDRQAAHNTAEPGRKKPAAAGGGAGL